MDSYGFFKRTLFSRTFALYLLVVMLAFLVVGSLLPDIDTMAEGEIVKASQARPYLYWLSGILRVQRLMSSPYFLALPVLIFLSTAVCTSRRVLFRTRKEGGFTCEAAGITNMGIRDIASLLSDQKWALREQANGLIADKGVSGFWGSVLFHAGLLLMFVAVVVSARTRFNAELLLTEGFPVQLGSEAFVKIYKSNGLASLPQATIELKRFVPTYERDIYKKDFSALLSVNGESREVHVNRPVEIGDFQLNLHRFGFAPSFRIADQAGREVLNATVNLVLADGASDSFLVPGTLYEVRAQFFPDFFSDGGKSRSRSALPKNPVFLLTVKHMGQQIGKGLIRLGDASEIGGLTITFDGLNYWTDMIVSKDHGVWLFAWSFVLIVLGLTVRFALPDKQLFITVSGKDITIKGWCKYYPSFFEDEVKTLLEKTGVERYT